MLTLEETLASQNNLYQLCAIRPFQIYEIFSGNAFYGNDAILKQYAELSETYALKAILPHGVDLSDAVWQEEIKSPLPVIFSYPPYREQTYISLIKEKVPNKVIIPSASPFLYLVELLKTQHKPDKNGTIFFPAHSTHHLTVQADWESLAEQIINFSEEYQPVTVCIYWRDFELGRHIPFQRRGMRIVSAGHMFDKYFLFRFYHLCSTHRYSASNELGSHIFFSVKAGCSYFHLDTIKCVYTAKNNEILNRDLALTPLTREEALKSLFKTPQPYTTAKQMETVDYYLGSQYLKSPEELRQQLLYAEELFNKIEPPKQIFSISDSSKKLLPQIIIDGVCFQLAQTNIDRIWKSLLQQWANNSFAKHIIVLDRAGTAPKIPGILYCNILHYDYGNTGTDQEMLQQVCDEEGADVFISTYYTTPITTPSVFMAYDMIPELMGWDLNHPMWREKHYGIKHAAAYIALSENTAQDIVKFFPNIPLESVVVAKNGVDITTFSVATQEEINQFKTKYGVSKPYFIVVAGGSGYQNSILFFQAFTQLASNYGFDIVCTGSNSILEPEFRSYTLGSVVHLLQLDNKELAIAYSAAMALVYLSKYEACNLPVLEAMACGCPVITGDNPSILEVAEEAAIYVNDDDVDGMINALCEVQKPSIRRSLIAAGLKQAKKFSLSKMAETVSSALIDATLLPLKLKEINFIIFPDWLQPEEAISLDLERVIRAIATHPDSDRTTLLIDTSNISSEDAEMLLSSVTMNLLMQEDVDVTEGLEISLIGDLAEIQWEALLPRIQARIILGHENEGASAQVRAESTPLRDLKSFKADL